MILILLGKCHKLYPPYITQVTCLVQVRDMFIASTFKARDSWALWSAGFGLVSSWLKWESSGNPFDIWGERDNHSLNTVTWFVFFIYCGLFALSLADDMTFWCGKKWTNPKWPQRRGELMVTQTHTWRQWCVGMCLVDVSLGLHLWSDSVIALLQL